MNHHYNLINAAIAIALIVGLVTLIDGGTTGDSIGINAFTAPHPTYSQYQFKGYDAGPFQLPVSREGFLRAQQLCAPTSRPEYSFPANQQNCCHFMCNDACNVNTQFQPSECFADCNRGCVEQNRGRTRS